MRVRRGRADRIDQVAVFALDVQADFADKIADVPNAARRGRGSRFKGEAAIKVGFEPESRLPIPRSADSDRIHWLN